MRRPAGLEDVAAGPAPRRLDVYVARDCPRCDEARRLALDVAARYPHVAVRVVDLGDVGAGAPAPSSPRCTPPPDVPIDVVAVPTYVLDGRVIALGNPAPDHLFARLGRTS